MGEKKEEEKRERESYSLHKEPMREKEWERENLNSKTLFYKACSLGLVKDLSNN